MNKLIKFWIIWFTWILRIIIYLYSNDTTLFFLFGIVKKLLLMYNNLLRQLFSGKCQLTSLRFNIPYNYASDNLFSHSMFNTAQYYCLTLRYLHIHLNLTCFLEQLIEHVPNLERLSVYLPVSWDKDSPSEPPIKRFVQSNEAWSNKVR